MAGRQGIGIAEGRIHNLTRPLQKTLSINSKPPLLRRTGSVTLIHGGTIGVAGDGSLYQA